jgi:ribosomal protein S18 acetylase RimI-like enzyme
MQIRPMQLPDLERLTDLDGTIESAEYLHLGQSGSQIPMTWAIERRPLRQKLIESNAPGDELRFMLKQIVSGIEEGAVLVAEHQEQVVGLAVVQPQPEANLLRLLDIRVDYDLRRQGVASAMLFQIIQQAREAGLRAIRAETKTNNAPINALLEKLGFDLSGMDTRHDSNHDLVKESVTLFWYLSFD